MENTQLTVSDFVALINQTLEFAYPSVLIVGEVAEFRISQGKWVTFKLKDSKSMVECFMVAYQLRVPIENGMKVQVIASPQLKGNWGRFSLTVRRIVPVGEGAIKKSFELLKKKLDAEGLFALDRKRLLPRIPASVAVITSTESAAYADFCKIINERWGGLKISVAHTQVQGEPAAEQIIRAIQFFNNYEKLPDVLVIIRGGGSAEDLMTFNDEKLTRAIAGSRIPTLVGVGHEVDHTLADMVADVRAATPTNAAEILVPDKRESLLRIYQQIISIGSTLSTASDERKQQAYRYIYDIEQLISKQLQATENKLQLLSSIIHQVNPDNILKQGYALLRGEPKIGDTIDIETYNKYITAEVKNVRER